MKFSEGLEKIGLQAFALSGLENIEFPASLRTIAQAAFAECKSLKTVKFNDGLEVLGTHEYADNGCRYCGFFQDSSVERVDLPTTLKKIEFCTFESCKNLKSIKLPNSLEYIRSDCFAESGLQTIEIPRKGVRIEGYVFTGCPAKSGLVFRGGRVFPKDQ